MSALRTVAHVLEKDLRRLWPVLAGIAVLAGLHMGGLLPTADRFGRFGYRLPLGLFPLLLALAAAICVQQDNPSSDRAFWSTRPLGGWSVLASKLAFLGLFLCALPVAAEALWLASLDADAPSGIMARDSAVALVSLLLVVAAGASITRSLRELIVLVFTVWVCSSIIEAVARHIQGLPRLDILSAEPKRQLATAALALAVLAHQYTTRHRARSVALGLAGLVAASLLRTDAVAPRPTAEAAAEAPNPRLDTLVVSARLDRLERGGFRPMPPDERPEAMVSAGLAFETPGGLQADVLTVRTDVLGAAGPRTFRPPPPWDRRRVHRRPPIAGSGPARDRRFSFSPPVVVATGSEEDMAGLADADRLELTLSLAISEWTEIGRLGTEPGASIALGTGDILIVSGTRRSAQDFNAILSLRWQAQSPSLRVGGSRPLDEDLMFALHSPRYREYLVDLGSSGVPATRTLLGTASLREDRRTLEFDARMAEGRDGPRLPDDWFDDVEIVVFQRRPLGSTTRAWGWDIEGWPTLGAPVEMEEEGEPIEPR